MKGRRLCWPEPGVGSRTTRRLYETKTDKRASPKVWHTVVPASSRYNYTQKKPLNKFLLKTFYNFIKSLPTYWPMKKMALCAIYVPSKLLKTSILIKQQCLHNAKHPQQMLMGLHTESSSSSSRATQRPTGGKPPRAIPGCRNVRPGPRTLLEAP